MARPKKDKCITYTKDVHFRLTETEYEILQKTAQDANLSISEYVRKVLNNQKVIVNYNLVADVPATSIRLQNILTRAAFFLKKCVEK